MQTVANPATQSSDVVHSARSAVAPHLSVRLANCASDVIAAQRLRYRVFVKRWARISIVTTSAMSIGLTPRASTRSSSMKRLAKSLAPIASSHRGARARSGACTPRASFASIVSSLSRMRFLKWAARAFIRRIAAAAHWAVCGRGLVRMCETTK